MNWFIIIGIILVISIALFIISVKMDYDGETLGGFSAGIFVIAIVVLVFMLLTLAGIKSDFNAFKTDYQFTKELIEDYEPGVDYGNTLDLTEKILDINSKIAKHRSQWDSPWYNLWRDKEIGELEALKLPSKKTVTQNE